MCTSKRGVWVTCCRITQTARRKCCRITQTARIDFVFGSVLLGYARAAGGIISGLKRLNWSAGAYNSLHFAVFTLPGMEHVILAH